MDTEEARFTNTQYSNHSKDIFDTKNLSKTWALSQSKPSMSEKVVLDSFRVLITNNKIYFDSLYKTI